MIVDLMRNDLGRVCRYGTVAVPELCRLEEHPGVWHLVSDVTGELSDSVSDADLLRATFPPGSVTGAPKVRAMELVSELEGTAREVYTGAVGIASPLSGLELNVAIRTFEIATGGLARGRGRHRGGLRPSPGARGVLRQGRTVARRCRGAARPRPPRAARRGGAVATAPGSLMSI